MDQNKSKLIFSKKIDARQRIYYFDVKESSKGVRFLVISQTSLKTEGTSRNKIRIFPETAAAFKESLEEALNSLQDK